MREAGSSKISEARIVVFHTQLAELSFAAFVKAARPATFSSRLRLMGMFSRRYKVKNRLASKATLMRRRTSKTSRSRGRGSRAMRSRQAVLCDPKGAKAATPPAFLTRSEATRG